MRVRCAIREEGGFLNAYLAPMDSMKDAVLLGSIAMPVVKADSSVYDKFKELMTAAMMVALTRVGVKPTDVKLEGESEPKDGN